MTGNTQIKRKRSKTSSPLSAKTIAILITAGLGLSAIGFGAGYLTGAIRHTGLVAQLDSQREEFEADRAEAVAKVTKEQSSARAHAAAANRRVAKLEARRELGRVLLSLSDQNFGTAQKHLDASVSYLEKSGQSKATKSLVKQLRDSRVLVTSDHQKQRTQFRDHIDRLDVLLDSSKTGT